MKNKQFDERKNMSEDRPTDIINKIPPHDELPVRCPKREWTILDHSSWPRFEMNQWTLPNSVEQLAWEIATTWWICSNKIPVCCKEWNHMNWDLGDELLPCPLQKGKISLTSFIFGKIWCWQCWTWFIDLQANNILLWNGNLPPPHPLHLGRFKIFEGRYDLD